MSHDLEDLLEWQALFAVGSWEHHRQLFAAEHFRDADMRGESAALIAGEAPGALSIESTVAAFAECNVAHVARNHKRRHTDREFEKRAMRLVGGRS